jgi:hypothetical protein
LIIRHSPANKNNHREFIILFIRENKEEDKKNAPMLAKLARYVVSSLFFFRFISDIADFERKKDNKKQNYIHQRDCRAERPEKVIAGGKPDQYRKHADDNRNNDRAFERFPDQN